jgi:MoCo/4Fe-4S cofactor protein with predicted Tat translocation signal
MSEISLHPSATEIATVQAKLRNARGKQFWRSLDQLVDTPEFRELIEREFPRGASEMVDGVSRRTFLKLMGASLALAGLSGCTFAIRQPQEKVAPFTRAPIEQTPGIPTQYATALTLDGFALGVTVKSHDGRPTKVEGNPLHPASLGATDSFAQAEILSLYDPDRPESVRRNGVLSSWETFVSGIIEPLQIVQANQGAGLRIVTGTVTSPTLLAQIDELLTALPQARWIQHEPIGRANTYAGTQLAFGRALEPRYAFDRASVVVALDADIVAEGPGRVRYARDLMRSRRARVDSGAMSRIYVAEPMMSQTGTIADARVALTAAEVGQAAAALAARLGVAGVAAPTALPARAEAWVAAAVDDLRAAGSAAVVVAGEAQDPAVHAIAHAINAALGAVGTTVEYTAPVARPSGTQSLAELADELRAGAVELLVVIDSNPAFSAPADFNFASALTQARTRVVLNAYEDETAAGAQWFIPLTHPLEMWSDARAYDGSAALVQPLILPLYAARTPHELLAVLNGAAGSTDYDLVRAYWKQAAAIEDDAAFDVFFKQALSDGLIADSRFAAEAVTPVAGLQLQAPTVGSGYELIFRPDAAVWDGRYANNGWLQELPRPVTKLTWDNAALVSPKTAVVLFGLAESSADLTGPNREILLEALTKENGRKISVTTPLGTLELPVWIVPGHAERTITVTLGYGRSRAGRVGNDAGFDLYRLRSSSALWLQADVTVAAVNQRYLLASTQDHWTMEGRDIVRSGEFAAFRADPKSIKIEAYTEKYGSYENAPDYQSLLPAFDYSTGNQWGMAIDLSACTGCNACVIACQAENNIPIVGKAEVAMGREMHWIRIDRYFGGDDFDNPEVYMMPVTCMHCERAPCELVCPVVATVHDAEGINNMVYNRCVGTKYCSNNCPYKVRRFNFLQYSDIESPSLALGRNPSVTVRNRGVMEKCTYCVQRISAARITAKVEGREIRDGEVISACQQVCPTEAIIFGNINDVQSKVARAKAEPHNYTVLDELNVKPRTSYLARVRNPNAALAGEG